MQNDITIIGGGFCGTAVLLQLVEKATEKGSILHIVWLNKGYPLAQGIAFSTFDATHLLNVPVGRMSVFADRPNHFLDWLQSQKNITIPAHIQANLATAFVPRQWYGAYLAATVNTVVSRLSPNIKINVMEAEAVDMEYFKYKKNVQISLANGDIIITKKVVLALGNQLPQQPTFLTEKVAASSLYRANPWNETAVNNLQKSDKTVFLFGTSLTMIDAVVSLTRLGFEGKIVALSTRGYLPLPHRQFAADTKILQDIDFQEDMPKLYGIFKRHIRRVHTESNSGLAVVDAVRPLTQKIWIDLQIAEKQRFMRHVRHLWGVARHRIPQEVSQFLTQLKAAQKFEILSGRVQTVAEAPDGLHITYRVRGTDAQQTIIAQRMINCTGPLTDIAQSKMPLLQNMLAKKYIASCAMRLGIDAQPNGVVLNSDAKPQTWLLAVGSLLKGVLWESTAVPELRTQAQEIAELIVNELIVVKCVGKSY